jgi:hypothetical protein
MQVRSTVYSMHFKQIDYRQVKIAHPAQTQEKKAKQSPPMYVTSQHFAIGPSPHEEKNMHKKGDQIDPP